MMHARGDSDYAQAHTELYRLLAGEHTGLGVLYSLCTRKYSPDELVVAAAEVSAIAPKDG